MSDICTLFYQNYAGSVRSNLNEKRNVKILQKGNAFSRLAECLNNYTKPRNIRDPNMKVPETDTQFILRTMGIKFSRGKQCIDKYFILLSTLLSLSGYIYFGFQQNSSVVKKK
jgi:hypothetical protein